MRVSLDPDEPGHTALSRLPGLAAHQMVPALVVLTIVYAVGYGGMRHPLLDAATIGGYLVAIIAVLHHSQSGACIRCLREAPDRAPEIAQRQDWVLRFYHGLSTEHGPATTALTSTPLLIDDVEISRLVELPALAWLFTSFYAIWLHPRLRTWCPHCHRDGPRDPVPDPATTP